MLHNIDTERRLYVLKEGDGYTCLGFDNAERRLRGVSDWMQFDAGNEVPGTREHYNRYSFIMAEGAQYSRDNGVRCPLELTPELQGLEGKRVEVTNPEGEKRRFWVGKSTGWLPCHLEIKTRRSTGGEPVYFPNGSKVRVIR